MTALEGQAALVTGASAGIGEATARALADEGANVAVVARRADRLRDLVEDLESGGVQAIALPTDVTRSTKIERSVEEAVDAFGRLDAVVANAGVMREGGVADLSDEAYHSMVDVNVDGAFFTARAALPHLRESRGTLVFVGSNAAVYPLAQNPVYAATKWWVRGFAHSLTARAGDEVSVSVVNPSTTRTEIGAQDGTPNAERFVPGEKLEPATVADAIVYAVGTDHPDVVTELNLFRPDEVGTL